MVSHSSTSCYPPCLIGVNVAFTVAEVKGTEFKMFKERKKEILNGLDSLWATGKYDW